MKKLLLLALMIVLIFTTGCGSSGEKKIGMIRHMNITEEAFDKFYDQNNDINSGKKQLSKHIFFDNMQMMLAALKSGEIYELTTYESVANYLIANDNSLERKTTLPRLSDNFCCAMLESNAALRDEFNDAIKQMTADGTLAKLVRKYIIEANHAIPPYTVKLPTFNGVKTIKIAITGDLPPLDYILEEGKPVGFNTAILAEISKRLKKNFVLVPVDAGARAVALTSGHVDVIFWVVIPADNEFIPSNIDLPDGVILTNPYFTDEIFHVKIRDDN